jgi:hypothetical protein
MDRDAFEDWLNAIRGMTAGQRGRGFLALSLAEAEGDTDVESWVGGADNICPRVVELKPVNVGPIGEDATTTAATVALRPISPCPA